MAIYGTKEKVGNDIFALWITQEQFDLIERTEEDTIEIDGEVYYIWCGELYQDKLETGYSKRIDALEIATK